MTAGQLSEIAEDWKPTPEQVEAHFRRAADASDKFAGDQERLRRDANAPEYLNRTYTI